MFMYTDYETLRLILEDGEEISINAKDTIETYIKNNSYPHQHWLANGVYEKPEIESHYSKNFILVTKNLKGFHSSLEAIGEYSDIRNKLQKVRNIIKVRLEFINGTYQEFFIKEHNDRQFGEPNRYQRAYYNKDKNFVLTISRQD